MSQPRSVKQFVGRCVERLARPERVLTEAGKLSAVRLRAAIKRRGLKCLSGAGSAAGNLWQLCLAEGVQFLFDGAEWECQAQVLRMCEKDNVPSSDASQFEAHYIASGGYASVYRLSAGGFDLALKTAHGRETKLLSLESQLREARLLKALSAKCSHSIVPRLWDYWVHSGSAYILTDYGGKSLRHLGVSLRWSDIRPLVAWDIAEQLLSGVQALHVAGFVHRDIKPGNLLYTQESGQRVLIKLIDYGLACRLAEAANKGVCGTPTYLGPWLWRSDYHRCAAGAIAADTWACFASLYALINASKGPLTGVFATTAEWRNYLNLVDNDELLERMELSVPAEFPVRIFSRWLIENLRHLDQQRSLDSLIMELHNLRDQFMHDHSDG
jgi:serine/threonine protein kinase